jgi:hypothetical protein
MPAALLSYQGGVRLLDQLGVTRGLHALGGSQPSSDSLRQQVAADLDVPTRGVTPALEALSRASSRQTQLLKDKMAALQKLLPPPPRPSTRHNQQAAPAPAGQPHPKVQQLLTCLETLSKQSGVKHHASAAVKLKELLATTLLTSKPSPDTAADKGTDPAAAPLPAAQLNSHTMHLMASLVAQMVGLPVIERCHLAFCTHQVRGLQLQGGCISARGGGGGLLQSMLDWCSCRQQQCTADSAWNLQ